MDGGGKKEDEIEAEQSSRMIRYLDYEGRDLFNDALP